MLLRRSACRRGYALVLFVFILMCCMALAAIVIDIGFVRLSKRQMQSMTDAAALEIQREVDMPPSQPFEMSEAGPTLAFEDDGAVLPSGFRVYPKLGNNSAGKWIPSLEPPEGNLSDDILIGRYLGAAELHLEESVDRAAPDYYVRPDFELDPAGADVLVRLRRTGEQLDEGGSAESHVPFLFGRGMVIGGSPDVWQRIERGTSVRQTSIATGAPARSAGPYLEAGGVHMAGLINVQVAYEEWILGDTLTSSQYTIFDDSELGYASIGWPSKESVSATIIETTPDDYDQNSGYVLITSSVGVPRHQATIVGFGFVRVDSETGSLQKISRQGYRNTSSRVYFTPAMLEEEQDNPGLIPNSVQLSAILARNLELFQNHQAVAAPALVRSED